MFRGINSIIYKETIHIIRDPRTLFLMLLVPGIQLTIFGYAIELDVKNIATAVYNLDGRQPSRELLDTFENSGYFEIVEVALSDDALVNAMVRGDAQVGIKIPPDYTDQLLAGQPAQVQVLIDGSDSTVAMQALNVAGAIGLQKSIQISSQTVGGEEPLIDMRPECSSIPRCAPRISWSPDSSASSCRSSR